eukprot:265516_1
MSQQLPEMILQICINFISKTADTKVINGLLGILRDLVLVRQVERFIRCDILPEDGIKTYFVSLIPLIIKCSQQSKMVRSEQQQHLLLEYANITAMLDGEAIYDIFGCPLDIERL